MSQSPLFTLYDPSGLLQQQADAGLLLDDEGNRRKPRIEDLLSEEEKSSLLGTLASAGTSGLAGAAYLFDTPGSAIRGFLAGKPSSVIGERVSGRDLLRQYGLIGDDDTWGNFAAGLATEVVTDPLTYLNPFSLLGRGAASMAGRAAGRAGLLDNAAVLARKQGKGLREFMTGTTARELVDNSPDPQALIKFSNAAKGKGLDPEELLDMPLAGLAELRVPGFERGALLGTGDVTQGIAKGLDRFGSFLETNRYTAPVVNRVVRARDPTVLDRLNPDDQWRAREAVAKYTDYDRDVRQNAARLYSAAREAGEGFDSTAIQNAIRDTIEANGDPEVLAKLQDQASIAKVESTPAWKEYRDWYRRTLSEAQARRAALGLETPNVQSLYGTGYMPRQAIRFAVDKTVDAPFPGRLPRRQSAYNRGAAVYATDDVVGKGRKSYLDLERPSETLRRLMTGDFGKDLRGRLFAAEPERMPGMIDQAFEALGLEVPYSRITTDDGLTAKSLRDYLADDTLIAADRKSATGKLNELVRRQQAMKVQLGELLRDVDPQFSEKGLGFFDRHTLTDMLRYGAGGARSEANAEVLLDSFVKNASDIPAESVPGGGHINLLQAAEGLGYNKARLREVLKARMPGRDIDQLSFPESALAEMKAVTQAPPESDSLLKDAYDSYTSLFKVGALANPGYHTRNLASGYLSTLMSGGFNPLGLVRSMRAGYQAGKGNYDSVAKLLADAPAYRGLSPQQIVAKFKEESARAKLGQGQAAEGALDSAVAAPSLVPGLDTQPGAGYWRNLLYNPDRSWGDWLTTRGVDVSGLLKGRRAPSETYNPLLQLHEQTGRRVEDALRIGTFVEALRQGYSPDAAARRVFQTQVDYAPEAFTSFQRKLKRVVPFASYPIGIAPGVLENMLYRPGGLQGQSMRAVASASRPSAQNFTPEHLSEAAAIPIPGGPEGLQRYFNFRALPYGDLLNLLSIGQGTNASQTLADTAQKTGLNLLGQLTPVIKYPLEALMDRQLYSGRELSDLYSVLERDLGPIGRQAEQLLVNMPFGSKAVSVYRTSTDKRLSPSEKALKLILNNTVGGSVSDIDPNKTRARAARQTLEELLRSSPEVQSYESLSVPEDALTSMPPDQQKLYLLYRVLQSEAARNARARKQEEAARSVLL